jgi:cytochrome c-type biogenesis protein CcmH/NrfF
MCTATTQAPSEPSATVSAVVTLFPLALLMVMFVLFLGYIRRARSNVAESLQLTRAMVAELRAIRAAVEERRGRGDRPVP